STTLLSSKRVGVSMAWTPSSMYLSTTSGMRSPIWMVMGRQPRGQGGGSPYRRTSRGARGLKNARATRHRGKWRQGAADQTSGGTAEHGPLSPASDRAGAARRDQAGVRP